MGVASRAERSFCGWALAADDDLVSRGMRFLSGARCGTRGQQPGERFPVAAPVVLWLDAPFYDAYQRRPRFWLTWK